jgi:hypothetical protein
MAGKKNIALVAHDRKKEELCEWAGFNRHLLAEHSLYATATTGHLLMGRLGLNVTCLQSGLLEVISKSDPESRKVRLTALSFSQTHCRHRLTIGM